MVGNYRIMVFQSNYVQGQAVNFEPAAKINQYLHKNNSLKEVTEQWQKLLLSQNADRKDRLIM